MATRNQISVSVLLAAGTSALAVLTVHSAISSSQKDYSGIITAAAVTPLNFETEGYIQQILVQPGQAVRAGQVLAKQDSAEADQALAAAEVTLRSDQAIAAADQSAVTADQQRINAYVHPEASSPQLTQDGLEVTKAQQALQAAQTAQQQSAAVESQLIAQTTAALHAYQAQLDADTSSLTQACPTSPAPAWESSRCQTLQSDVGRDQIQVANAQGALGTDQAEATRTAAQMTSEVAQAQTSVSIAEELQAVQTAQAPAATVADAQATLARDQAQVVRDDAAVSRDQESMQAAQLTEQRLTITAPADAVVLQVAGTIGALADSSGVRRYGDSSGSSSVAQTTGVFSLLPPAPESGGAASAASNATLPVVAIRQTGAWQISSLVPETALTHFAAGRRAKVSIPAANLHGLAATVSTVDQMPRTVNGSVDYQVTLQIASSLPASVLPGMTADLSLG